MGVPAWRAREVARAQPLKRRDDPLAAADSGSALIVPAARLAPLVWLALGLCLLPGRLAFAARAQRASATVTRTGECPFTVTGGQWAAPTPVAARNNWHLLWGLGPAALKQWEHPNVFCTFAAPYAKLITLEPNHLPGATITAGPKGWGCRWISKNNAVCTRHPKGSPDREAFGFFPAPTSILG